MFGESYISEYIIDRVKEETEEKSFKLYVTECLQAISENTTHYLTGNGIEDYGKSLKKRWIDIIEPPQKVEVEDIDIDKAVSDMWDRARGKGAKNGT